MARLPVPGQDNGVWGNILNEYLSRSLDANGDLQADSVGQAQIQAGAVTTAKVSTNIQASLAKADASIAATTANATFVKSVNGITPDGTGDVIIPAPQDGQDGVDGQDGASITVTLVSAENWPAPNDPDPNHWYVKVP